MSFRYCLGGIFHLVSLTKPLFPLQTLSARVYAGNLEDCPMRAVLLPDKLWEV
jgi:hypothetical protein